MSVILGATGAVACVSGLYGAFKQLPTVQLRSIIRTTLNMLEPPSKKYSWYKQIQLKSLSRQGNVYTALFKLPAGFSSQEFRDEVLVYLAEASFAGETRMKHVRGNLVEVTFGYEAFEEKMDYDIKLIDPERPLAVPLYSPFGTIYIDFGEESTCHLLTGGASRMGKSVFLRLLVMHLMLSTKRNVQFYFIDNKITDLYPFKDIPQIFDAETEDDALEHLQAVRKESERRKEVLKKAGNVVDAKEYRAKYPNRPMDTIFVVIDEYARFAEHKEIQEEVTYIAETAGYVDIHLVIASQRPDVKDVLKPRIRANLLARIAFSTPDEANSKIILDLPDAAYLGRIKGRAIYSDGFPNKVQVPYIEADAARVLLKPYIKNGWWNLREHTGREDSGTAETLPNHEPRPVGDIGGFGEHEPSGNRKPSSKKTGKGRGHSPGAKS